MTQPTARDVRRMANDDIGGARVLSPFTFGDRRLKAGDMLSEAEVRSIPRANLDALKGTDKIHVLTKTPPPNLDPTVQRVCVNRGFGKWDVWEGRKLNGEPLSKEEAEQLAGHRGTEEQRAACAA